MGKNILGIFDGNDLEGVSALIDKLEESSFDYLKLEGDGVSLIIGKNGAGEAGLQSTSQTAAVGGATGGGSMSNGAPTAGAAGAAASSGGTSSAAANATAAADAPNSAGASASIATNTDASPLAQSKGSVPEQEGIFTVKSPSYGLFYSQSEPGAPPYVTVGAVINEDDTIGLIEIMKTFTAITSPVAGEVVAIHINNEETLEPDMPLVSIKVQ